jgi:hypothetical protein
LLQKFDRFSTTPTYRTSIAFVVGILVRLNFLLTRFIDRRLSSPSSSELA